MPEEQAQEYVEFTSPTGDVDYGKIAAGRVLPMSPERAAKLEELGIAKKSSKSAFEKQRKERQDAVEPSGRKADFEKLATAADWDVTSTRDALNAPEEGLKRAFAQGRVVNTDLLKDKDGNVLPADASLEQILEARRNVQATGTVTDRNERTAVQADRPPAGSDLDSPPPYTAGPPTKEQTGNAPETDPTRKPRGSRKDAESDPAVYSTPVAGGPETLGKAREAHEAREGQAPQGNETPTVTPNETPATGAEAPAPTAPSPTSSTTSTKPPKS